MDEIGLLRKFEKNAHAGPLGSRPDPEGGARRITSCRAAVHCPGPIYAPCRRVAADFKADPDESVAWTVLQDRQMFSATKIFRADRPAREFINLDLEFHSPRRIFTVFGRDGKPWDGARLAPRPEITVQGPVRPDGNTKEAIRRLTVSDKKTRLARFGIWRCTNVTEPEHFSRFPRGKRKENAATSRAGVQKPRLHLALQKTFSRNAARTKCPRKGESENSASGRSAVCPPLKKSQARRGLTFARWKKILAREDRSRKENIRYRGSQGRRSRSSPFKREGTKTNSRDRTQPQLDRRHAGLLLADQL